MLLNSRTTRILLESAERAGIPRRAILEPLALVEADLVDPSGKVDWMTVVRMCDEISRLVGGDPARLREVGAMMAISPSYEPLRRLASAMFTAPQLYSVATRWVAPANFPHCSLEAKFVEHGRLVLRGTIPESYPPSLAFMHVFEGSATHLSTLLGLPPSTIVESRVTPRTLHLVLELPPSPGIFARVRRGVGTLLAAPGAVRVLERERTELAVNVEALRRAREELRVLLDRLPDLVVIHVDGRIVWANQLFVDSLGYDRLDDVLGSELLSHVAARCQASVRARMQKPVEEADVQGALDLQEFILRARSGAEVTVEVAPTQSVIFEGVSARLIVGHDVSDRLAMQQKLIVADRLASIGLLAAGVAHEVNNPLAYVLNNVEIARKELAHLGPEADVSRHVLGVALEGVDRIRAIVRDLLMLSRGDAGNVGATDVGAVAQSTLSLAAREIERTATLVREIEPALVRGSDSRIAQVLLNLVGNALEAMQGKPRAVNTLLIRVASREGRVVLEVIDTGRGISPADLPRLFEPFFTTKPAGQGTGLGLAIAQRLVLEMGGEIEVSSELGSGTTFRVLLPAHPSSRERRSSQPQGLIEPQPAPHPR